MRRRGFLSAILLICLSAALVATRSGALTVHESRSVRPRSASLAQRHATVGLGFVANVGQLASGVRFSLAGSDGSVAVGKRGFAVDLSDANTDRRSPSRNSAIAVDFVGARSTVPIGIGARPVRVTFISKHATRSTDRAYGAVRFDNSWPGVSALLQSKGPMLETTYVIGAEASASAVRLRYRGAESVSVARGGALIVRTRAGVFTEHDLMAYQRVGRVRVPVSVSYELRRVGSDVEVGFRVGAYDRSRLLVIDPSSFVGVGLLGGSGSDGYNGVAVDASGAAYVTGSTDSADFRTTAGSFQPISSPGSGDNAFVAKVSADGSQVVYSTFLEGGASNNFAEGWAIAVDGNGSAYVTGVTGSSDFPTTAGSFDPGPGTGDDDVFVTKLNPEGSALVYSTFLKGSGVDIGYAIAVDAAGDAYVGGQTSSADFPITAGAYAPTWDGRYDGFITKLNASGSALIFSTYLGGTPDGWVTALAVDGEGSVYATGRILSYGPPDIETFPIAGTPFDPTYGGDGDAFVEKLTALGVPVYGSYLGGSGFDSGTGIAVDSAGEAYVVGATSSTDLPVTADAFDTTAGNGFAVKVSSDGASLDYATYIPEVSDARAAAVDSLGDLSLVGQTTSPGFPTTANAADASYNAPYAEGYVMTLNPAATSELYGSYIGGGAGDSSANAVAVAPTGALSVVGLIDGKATPGPDLSKSGVAAPHASPPLVTVKGGSDDLIVHIAPVTPARTIGIGDASIVEGDTGTRTLRFPVTLSVPSTTAVTVSYTIHGITATGAGSPGPDVDFNNRGGNPQTVTFTPSVTSGLTPVIQYVPVTVYADTAVESNETLSVTLSGPTGGYVLFHPQAIGTILNDDKVAAATLSVGSASVVEGNRGSRTIAFPVTLSQPAGSAVTAHYATESGTAHAGQDFIATSGTVTIPKGTTTSSIDVSVLGDTTIEPDENFSVTLSSPTGAAINDATATGTILNDDGGSYPRGLTVSIGSGSVVEGNVGTRNVLVPVTLSQPSSTATTVHYATKSGTAAQGTDFVATSGTIHIPAGVTGSSIAIAINGDQTVEPNETFTVALSSPAGATINRATGTVTILNDDGTIGIGSAALVEGNSASRTLLLPVTLSRPSTTAVSVTYKITPVTATHGASTAAGSDFGGSLTGTLTFTPPAPGDLTPVEATISIPIWSDLSVERDETFTVTLSSVSLPGVTIIRPTSTGTILNDD